MKNSKKVIKEIYMILQYFITMLATIVGNVSSFLSHYYPRLHSERNEKENPTIVKHVKNHRSF